MNLSRMRLLELFVLAAFVFQTAALGEVVYDSLSTSRSGLAYAGELGNTITLSGNKRFITGFSINVGTNSSNAGDLYDFILKFYSPSAPDDCPGKLIWQSPPKTNIEMTGDIQTVTFEVPHVRVQDTFIYSIQMAGNGYFTLCQGPNIGSSPDYGWSYLTRSVSSFGDHLQVRIEAEERQDARLLGWIDHSSFGGHGGPRYSMRFVMGFETWNMIGPSFHGVTEWDKGSYLQMKVEEAPEAIDYLTNGIDEELWVSSSVSGSIGPESDMIVKPPGIAEGYPDLHGCILTDIVLGVHDIIIDNSEPNMTLYTWDVTWEIWGFEKSADLNRDGLVDFFDLAMLAPAWDSQPGQSHWNPIFDINLPGDNHINFHDLQCFCSSWLNGAPSYFEENFETGDFSLYDWQQSGDSGWNVVSNVVFADGYSARSGAIADSEQSTLQLEISVEEGYISFFKKVSSESSYDYLHFYIDGVEQGKWSGAVDWSQESFPVTAGSHTFTWSYVKDFIASDGSDCAWIDQIKVE